MSSPLFCCYFFLFILSRTPACGTVLPRDVFLGDSESSQVKHEDLELPPCAVSAMLPVCLPSLPCGPETPGTVSQSKPAPLRLFLAGVVTVCL